MPSLHRIYARGVIFLCLFLVYPIEKAAGVESIKNILTPASLADAESLDQKQQAALKLLLPSLFKSLKNSHSFNRLNNKNYPQNLKNIYTLSHTISHRDAALISIQSMVLIGDARHSQLIIQSNKKIFYTLYSDSTHQILTLVLENINPDASFLPAETTSGAAVQKIQTVFNSDDQLVITFLLTPGVDVQGLYMTGENPVNLALALGVEDFPPYDRNFKVKTPAVKTITAYQKLVKTEKPLFSPAEKENQKNYGQALNLLRQNKPGQALKLLHSFALPDIEEHQDYYILLAEICRRTNNAAQAIKIYQTLLTHSPENATLWAGLGISFEAAGQYSEALSAYQKSVPLSRLTPVLAQYVQAQLKLEKGRN